MNAWMLSKKDWAEIGQHLPAWHGPSLKWPCRWSEWREKCVPLPERAILCQKKVSRRWDASKSQLTQNATQILPAPLLPLIRAIGWPACEAWKESSIDFPNLLGERKLLVVDPYFSLENMPQVRKSDTSGKKTWNNHNYLCFQVAGNFTRKTWTCSELCEMHGQKCKIFTGFGAWEAEGRTLASPNSQTMQMSNKALFQVFDGKRGLH